MTLPQFWDELNKHDWYYRMSESISVYNKGRRSEKNLIEISGESEAHSELFAQFLDYYCSDSRDNNKKKSKPERPM